MDFGIANTVFYITQKKLICDPGVVHRSNTVYLQQVKALKAYVVAADDGQKNYKDTKPKCRL